MVLEGANEHVLENIRWLFVRSSSFRNIRIVETERTPFTAVKLQASSLTELFFTYEHRAYCERDDLS